MNFSVLEFRWHVATLLIIVSAIFAGCGDDRLMTRPLDEIPASISAPRDAAAARLVPPEIRAAGSIAIAVDPTFPPMEFITRDRRTMTGMSIDLANALGQALSLRVVFRRVAFDDAIQTVRDGDADLAISSITDTRDRERKVDLVTYFWSGTSFYAPADARLNDFRGLNDLCGLTVAVINESTQADDVSRQARRCARGGRKAPRVKRFDDQLKINGALRDGDADITLTDSPVVTYLVDRSRGEFQQLGNEYGAAPYGIAIAKDSGMDRPVLAALRSLINGGQYDAILAKWNLATGTVGRPRINGAER